MTEGFADNVMLIVQVAVVLLVAAALGSLMISAFKKHGKWMVGIIVLLFVISFVWNSVPSKTQIIDRQIADAQHRSAQINALNAQLRTQPGSDLEKWLRDDEFLCSHAVKGRLSDCLDLVRDGTFTSFNDGNGVVGIRVQRDVPSVQIGKRLTQQRTGKSNTVVDLRDGDKLRLDLAH